LSEHLTGSEVGSMQDAAGVVGANLEFSWLIQITSTVDPIKKSNIGPGEVHV